MIITDKDVETAIHYLAQTDKEHGQLSGMVKAFEHKKHVIRSQEFLDANGTMAEKEAYAYASQAYKNWIEEYRDAVMSREIIGAKRKRAELTIEVWRTEAANRRQGSM